MRQLGVVADEHAARRFEDYLLTKGIVISIDRDPAGWKLWVRNEDHLEEARREFAAFTASPDAAAYRDAERAANALRAREQQRAKAARKNFVNMGQRWRSGGVARFPVTSVLIAVCVGVAVASDLGENDSIVRHLLIDYQWKTPGGTVAAHAWLTEPWRLITPIFLHFGLLHIVFNMTTLWQFGRPIEMLCGSWKMALLVLATGIPSNVAQYLWHGPYFGGMSGVLYGLFGYMWMKSRYEPESGFHIPQSLVIWFIGWTVLCLTGLLPVANAAHGGGLVVGMILGRFNSVWKKMR